MHNGNAAAIYTKENLLNHVLGAIPRGLGRDEWLQALPRALVAGFVKTNEEFQSRGMELSLVLTFILSLLFYFPSFTFCCKSSKSNAAIIVQSSSGETSTTTATFVIVDRWTVTVASVEDSRCILDAQGGAVYTLTVDHRLEKNVEECVSISKLYFFTYSR